MVDKPEGITSHDVVAFARRILGQSRIGHTGTLDPFATGVLPLACGRATRLVRFMSASDKAYQATVRFGIVTDTYDITGTEVRRSDARPAPDDVRSAIQKMVGEQMQTPPPFSAKRIGGKRAYDLARAKSDVTLAPVKVRLNSVEVLEQSSDRVTVKLDCSAGYYVRSFAHDIGERLGVGACLETLRRTRSGEFDLSGAPTLTDLDAGRGLDTIRPLSALLPDFPAVVVTARGSDRFRHGQTVRPIDIAQLSDVGRVRPVHPASVEGEAWVRILDEAGALIGLGTPWDTDGTLRPNIVLT